MKIQPIMGAALLLGAAFAAHAAGPLNCKRNAMTDEQTCFTAVESDNNGFYFGGWADGKMSLAVNIRGQSSSWDADAIYFRINGGPAIKVEARALNSDVNCRSGSCKWSNSAVATLDADQWRQLAGAQELLISIGEGPNVAEPIKGSPAAISDWLAQFAGQGITPGH